MSRYTLICLIIAAVCMNVSYAREGVRNMDDAFRDEKYHECISLFVNRKMSDEQLPLVDATMLAISMDKLQNPAETEKLIERQLEGSKNGLQYFTAMKRLISDDTRGLELLFPEKAITPSNADLYASLRLLTQHKKIVAAQAFTVLFPSLPANRIHAWLAIPIEKRGPLDKIMDQRYPINSPNRMQLIRAMLNLYTNLSDDDAVIADTCLNLLLWYGKGSTLISLKTADDLLFAGKKDGAVRLATSLVTEQDTDVDTLRQLTAFLLRANEYALADEVYSRALKVVPEPYARELRLDYLDFLNTAVRLQPKGYTPKTLQAVQAVADPLLAGDALLFGERYDDASAKYLVVIQDAQAPLGHRLAAWGGLLDSDPGAALQHCPVLLDRIEKHDAITRGDELRWLGWQLTRALSREIPPKPGTFKTTSRQQFRPLNSVKGWRESLASIIDRMRTIDQVALLQPDRKSEQGTFRYTAAIVYGLAGKAKEAETVITKPITYTLLPPPGGWPTFGEPKSPDADKPRQFSSPDRGEAERVMKEVMAALARYQAKHATEVHGNPPLNVALIADMATQIIGSEDQATMKSLLRRMGEQVTLAVSTIDHPQQIKASSPATSLQSEQKVAQFAPVADAVQKVFADKEAVRESPQLLFFGLKQSMLIAGDQKLLDELFVLTINGFTQYIAATGDSARGASLAHSFATALDARGEVDLKPYARRLRDQFRRPEEK